MKRIRAIFRLPLVLSALAVFGQEPSQRSYGPISVETPYGKIVFRNVTLWQYSQLTMAVRPWFGADLDNLTGTTWHILEFEVGFTCPGSTVPDRYQVIIPTLSAGTNAYREPYPQTKPIKQCDPLHVDIRLTGGGSDRGAQEELDRRQAEKAARDAEQEARESERVASEQAEQKRLAALRAKVVAERQRQDAERRAYLSKFPVLRNGNPSLFVGSDRKCAEQFMQALSMDGLELRKRLAELVSYGCGFVEVADTHASKLQQAGQYCLVKLIEGEHVGDSGWVPCGWIR